MQENEWSYDNVLTDLSLIHKKFDMYGNHQRLQGL